MSTPLTKEALADAFDCFWNAAMGEAINRQSDIGVASIMAVGISAVAERLKEPISNPWAVREIESDEPPSRRFEVILPNGRPHFVYAVSYEDALGDARVNWEGGA